MRFNKYIMIALILLVVAGACKKEDSQPTADVFYAVAVEGNDVTFTNQTTGATSYKWDFGDGDSSTEASPVHTYPGKGKYVPTLYAYTSNGKVSEGSTVINIAKTSPVKLDDNTLSDWDTISTYVVTPPASETYFKKAKFDYDANYIYMYFEVNAVANSGNIYDFYIDTDNSAGTGLLTGTFPDGGYDVLLEGSIFGNWLDPFNFAGATQNDFGWSGSGASEFYQTGATAQDGSTYKFEMRITRSKLKNLAAATAFRIGIEATKSDWSATLGDLPGGKQSSVLVTFE